MLSIISCTEYVFFTSTVSPTNSNHINSYLDIRGHNPWLTMYLWNILWTLTFIWSLQKIYVPTSQKTAMSITVDQLIVLRCVIGVDCENHISTYTLRWWCRVCDVTADVRKVSLTVYAWMWQMSVMYISPEQHIWTFILNITKLLFSATASSVEILHG